MLEVRPSSGTYLRNGGSDLLPQVIEWGPLLGEQRTEDVIEARGAVEVTLAQLAAVRRIDEDLRELEGLLSQMANADNDVALYTALDVKFHLAIAAAARNEILAGVLRSLQSLLEVWTRQVITAAGETYSSLERHVPILEAIRAGDSDAAGGAHMERAGRRLRAAVARSSHPGAEAKPAVE